MWEMYQKRSGAWQMRFRTISNGGSSPASTYRVLSHGPEVVPSAGEDNLDVYSGLDSPDRGLSQCSASPTHPLRLTGRRPCTNETVPHFVTGPGGSVGGCSTREAEECDRSPGSPRIGRQFSYQCHPYDEGWERRRPCEQYGSYSPPRRRSGPSSIHLRQVCQHNGAETSGRELKPVRRVWQDVEVPLNTSPPAAVESSTESAPSPTQSHGESTVNQSTSNEEVSHGLLFQRPSSALLPSGPITCKHLRNSLPATTHRAP